MNYRYHLNRKAFQSYISYFIYLNDIVKSDSGSVGIAFADQSSISIDPGATMIIDDFVYDPENPTTGSMNANVLEGNFSFVSGQIAKTSHWTNCIVCNLAVHQCSLPVMMIFHTD